MHNVVIAHKNIIESVISGFIGVNCINSETTHIQFNLRNCVHTAHVVIHITADSGVWIGYEI